MRKIAIILAVFVYAGTASALEEFGSASWYSSTTPAAKAADVPSH